MTPVLVVDEMTRRIGELAVAKAKADKAPTSRLPGGGGCGRQDAILPVDDLSPALPPRPCMTAASIAEGLAWANSGIFYFLERGKRRGGSKRCRKLFVWWLGRGKIQASAGQIGIWSGARAGESERERGLGQF